MNALEKELSSRVRRLLKSARPDVDQHRTTSCGRVAAQITYSKDGDDEWLSVWLDAALIYEEKDGETVRPGILYVDKVHMAVLDLRKNMLLDDLANEVEAPIDSILERDDV